MNIYKVKLSLLLSNHLSLYFCCLSYIYGTNTQKQCSKRNGINKFYLSYIDIHVYSHYKQSKIRIWPSCITDTCLFLIVIVIYMIRDGPFNILGGGFEN